MHVARQYEQVYGITPEVVTRSPGRVELLGNHTDYNEGLALSFAIDKEIQGAASKRQADHLIRLHSTQYGDKPVIIDALSPRRDLSWVNYPLGVYATMKAEGYAVHPFSMAFHGTIPQGAGLSSSAALEVTTALALRELFRLDIDDLRLAKLCQKAENEFVGAKCGLLDQLSSLFGKAGHVLFIDFRTHEHETVAMPEPDLRISVATTDLSHSLVASAYNRRRRECAEASEFFARKDRSVSALRDVSVTMLDAISGKMDKLLHRRASHVVWENERVLRSVGLLNRGDLRSFGMLLYESHESSRVNFENSCPELDLLVETARTIPGVYGSRLTGGGWGGATVTLLAKTATEAFKEAIVTQYERNTGRQATVHFASIADGASVVRRRN